jgi:4a-hydroxytetrahydrobiopterin dehydratase
MKKRYLHNLKCTACSGKTPKLSDIEINNNLNNINDWNINIEREMIFKKTNFKTFKHALDFVNLIGHIAEKEKHHPDISLGYGYCLIMIHTHAIKGLSINDFILASKIDQITL